LDRLITGFKYSLVNLLESTMHRSGYVTQYAHGHEAMGVSLEDMDHFLTPCCSDLTHESWTDYCIIFQSVSFNISLSNIESL
jgi:uncharacterized protein RhaS with RHS repeats